MSHHLLARTFAALTLMALALAPAAFAAAPEDPGQTFPVSVDAAGVWADGEGVAEFSTPSISADGRYVAFESASTNLGESGPAGVGEGYVKDLVTGAVVLVSRADGDGGEAAAAPGISGLKLSADGHFVIFDSAATNLGTVLPEEEAGETHVYRRDLESGETTLVDRVSGAGGAILSRGARAASISANGRYVAFSARVANLEDPAGDHAETAHAVGYVRDLVTGVTSAISRASGASGALADEPAERLALAPDGRSVAFVSRATNLVPGVDEGVWEQVYRRDLETDVTTLVSQNALGAAGDRGSTLPAVSGASGCRVTFSSIAFNLLQPSPLEVSGEQVYVADVCANPPTVTLISQNATAPFAPFAYSVAATSDDGTAALFAAEFVGSPCCHLYLRDLAAGQTSQLDRASGTSGTSADGELEEFALSANGCRAVFASRATNLVIPGPPPGPRGEEPTELYVRQLKPCTDFPPLLPLAPDLQVPRPEGNLGPVKAAVGKLTLRSLSRRRVAVELSGPGTVTVRLRRLIERPHRHWQLVDTLDATATAAGPLGIPLPGLAPGRYRLNLHLYGAPRGIVRWLQID